MANDRPPIALHAEIETADGLARYRWDGSARNPEDRPQAIQCGSTVMNGFATGGCSLARHAARNYPDLGLYDTLRFVGLDGRIAYEGRGSRFPREASTQHRIAAETVGWMAHARDRAILFLGIDKDMASWGAPTAARQAALQASGFATKGAGEVMWDKTLSQSFDGPWPAGSIAICEAWFDAGPGQSIGRIDYASAPGPNVSEADPLWVWQTAATEDTLLTAPVGPGNLNGAPANSGTYTVTAAGKRYAMAHFYYSVASGVADTQYNLDWTELPIVGAHGLTLHGDPIGLLASDIIIHTAGVACPLLDTSEVVASVHPIEQFAIRDLTDPYDIWLLANAYERRNLAVWENRKLRYDPFPDVANLQTADWVLRSDHGNNLRRSYDGPTTDGQKNGAIVKFQNILTGQADMIDPTTHSVLYDGDTRLAANRAGINDWEAIQLPNPNTPAGAARIGAQTLREFNRQRTPGRFQVTGHIMDPAGNWHPGWVARAGQTVLLEEDDDDPIRAVHEVGWLESGELTVTADAASKTVDAILADIL